MWRRDVRYLVSFDVAHPASERPTKPAPAIWIAPLKHTWNDASQNYTLHIAGPTKWGTVCTPPAHRQAALATAFDACAAVRAAGLRLPQPTSADACVAALQARRRELEQARTPEAAATLLQLPYTAPPLAAATAQGAAAEGGCPQGSIWSARAGGECVTCAHGTLTQVASGVSSPRVDLHTTNLPARRERCRAPHKAATACRCWRQRRTCSSAQVFASRCRQRDMHVQPVVGSNADRHRGVLAAGVRWP